MLIYDNIREIAKEKKITIDSIEREAGLGRGGLSKWNTVSPSVSNLLKVAHVLNVQIDDLIREEASA